MKVSQKIITVRCKHCNKSFTRPAWMKRHEKLLYCSTTCHYAHRKHPDISKICKACHTTFTVSYSRRNRLFCTPTCFRVSRSKYYKKVYRKQSTCRSCGTPFMASRTSLRSGHSLFCSMGCREAGNRVNRKCEICHTKFTVDRNVVLRGGGRFCSGSCRVQGDRLPREQRLCLGCGEIFFVNPHLKKGYCSAACRSIGKHTKRVCKGCGAKFVALTSRVRKGQALFCSLACSLQSGAHHATPNKAELFLDSLINEVAPGDYHLNVFGDVIIERKIPDWVNKNGQKKIIELYGEHVHPVTDEAKRKKLFARYGYRTLIIWHRELRHPEAVKLKLQAFNVKEASAEAVGMGG